LIGFIWSPPKPDEQNKSTNQQEGQCDTENAYDENSDPTGIILFGRNLCCRNASERIGDIYCRNAAFERRTGEVCLKIGWRVLLNRWIPPGVR
jgi:hypothetical protein